MSTSSEYLEMLLKGSIVGCLTGDALAYPYRFSDKIPSTIRMKESDLAAGSYTYGGAMMLCTIASLNECNEIDTEDIMTKLHEFYVSGFMASGTESGELGLTTMQSIKNHANGMPHDKCGLKDVTDCGNLPRMLPLGLFCSEDNELIEMSHKVCKITHGHIRNQICSVIYCMLIRNILLQRAQKVFNTLKEYYAQHAMEEYAQELNYIREWNNNNTITGGNDVVNSFWSAWRIYATNQEDYQHTVCCAIKLGNNTNTTASLAGSLAGLRNGLNDIPQRWLNDLSLSTEVMDEISIFVNRIVRKASISLPNGIAD
jgi:ADP-ribosyl-[dinitrogen reductase] hydrolase